MRIISPAILKEYADRHPKAVGVLKIWQTIVEKEEWKKPEDIKKVFSSVDIFVTGKLKRTLYIFNVCGNSYRLICAIHFNTGLVFMREFLTHAEYDKERWKNDNDRI